MPYNKYSKCSSCATKITNRKVSSGKCKPCWAFDRRKPKSVCTECGVTLSIRGLKFCSSCAIQGKNNPNYKGKIKKTCKCGTAFEVEQHRKNTAKFCSVYCKKRYSISNIKTIEYKGILLRSTWEVAYAEYLDRLGYSWKYEPKAFKTPFGYYTPDFWVEELGAYVEVKGWFRDDAEDKFNHFKKHNPIILANMEYLKSIGFKFKKMKPVWVT